MLPRCGHNCTDMQVRTVFKVTSATSSLIVNGRTAAYIHKMGDKCVIPWGLKGGTTTDHRDRGHLSGWCGGHTCALSLTPLSVGPTEIAERYTPLSPSVL